MKKNKYEVERIGQIEFFDNYGIDWRANDEILANNTDGVYNVNIIEFKLNVKNINSTLLQAIKYLSRLRIKGESVPATIILVDLNDCKAYIFKSADYINHIQKVYFGAASKENTGFVAHTAPLIIDYDTQEGSLQLKNFLIKSKKLQEMYVPIDIDETCILGWAERYYRELPKASKGDFLGDETGVSVKMIGEIRDPKYFKGLINPYQGPTNEKFKYLMGVLNSRLQKKDLGAFYTPMPYAKKAAELVKMAVDRVPEGNDYIILDRCAGTGNLEEALIGIKDKNDEELIEHCIVSTYEYYEYKVLNERIGHKVKAIIPPSEQDVQYESGKVANADAMSEEFINNPIIKQYIDNPKCTIIMFENPPYRDASAANKTKDTNSKTKASFVSTEMSLAKDNFTNPNISTVRDLTNQFIWSAFEYYLRDKNDAYILFSPAKWWKSCGIVDCKMVKGYLFNRQYFNASQSAITCVYWANQPDKNTENITLISIGDIDNMDDTEDVVIKKCHKTFSHYFGEKAFSSTDGVFCESSGYEAKGRKCDGVAFYQDNIIGYLTPKGFTMDANNNNLVRATHYNNRGTYITKENFLQMCPLFTAKEYPQEKYYEKGESSIFFTTSDGGDKYIKDDEFLMRCLIYTCLSNQNKCLSFKGSDGRDYQNELCFDKDTVAFKQLEKYISNNKLNSDEKELLSLWNKILEEAKKTRNYNSILKYGVYQINKELNTFTDVKINGKNKKVYDYAILNSDLETLKQKLKEYYKKYISEKMFKYELLK